MSKALIAQEHELNITSVNLYETSTNKGYRVNVEGKPIFFRVGRAHPEELGIDRKKELENYKIAEKLGLAPTLLGFHLKDGLLMSEFIEGEVPSVKRIREEEFVESLVAELKKLHDHSGEGLRPAEKTVFTVNDALFETWMALDVDSADEKRVREWRKKRESFEARYYDGIPKAICHGDLYRENLIETYDRKKIYIVDWEYSFYGYVVDDLGKIAAANWFNDQEINLLAQAYWGKRAPELVERLRQNIFMQHMNFCIWCLIQAQRNPELAQSYHEVCSYAGQQLDSW